MSNPSEARCPRCAAPLLPSAPEGLCPRCLGALNLATDTVLTGADAVAAQPPLTPAELAPHFPHLEIIECLGRGGMGVVYRVRQKALNRLAALKLLAPERVTDAGFAERFTREAQALARLNHPNIVTIYDFGCTRAGDLQSPSQTPPPPPSGDYKSPAPPLSTLNPQPSTAPAGFYFLLMEFMDGVNLRQAMRTERFTPEQALAIVPPVCEALQYAHEQGIVHRDIKPENLLLDKAGRLKIADFGIAKMLGDGPADSRRPQMGEGEIGGRLESAGVPSPAFSGTTAGTPGYMAPEQKSAPQLVDSRADIYSLGVVIYEMLTGELPAEKLQPPSRKVQIDVRLDEIVLRALEQRPELRFQTAADLRTQVETIATSGSYRRAKALSEPTDQQRAENFPQPQDWRTSLRVWLVGLVGGLLSFAILVTGFWLLAVTTHQASKAASHPVYHWLSLLLALLLPALGTWLLWRFLRNASNRQRCSLHDSTDGTKSTEDVRETASLAPTPLLKTANAYVSTPEWLASARGKFLVYSGKGTLVLTRDQLAFTDAQTGTLVTIPLAAIRDVSLGNYPWFAKPAPLHYVSVTWEAAGQTRRHYFTPNRGWFCPVWETNPIVLDWHQALRAAVTATTGQAPTETPAPPHNPTVSDLVWMVLLFGLPMGLIGVVFFNLNRVAAPAGPVSPADGFVPGLIGLAVVIPFLTLYLLPRWGRQRGGPQPPQAPRKLSLWPTFALAAFCAPLLVHLMMLPSGKVPPEPTHEIGRLVFSFPGTLVLAALAGVGLWLRHRREAPSHSESSRIWSPGLLVLIPVLLLLGILCVWFTARFQPPSGVTRFDTVPVGVSNNVVIVDVTTEVGRGNAELRAMLDGPPLPAATEAALADAFFPPFAGTFIKPTPHAGNHPWRILAPGRQTWRLGFVLPDAALAKDAMESLHPVGPLPAVPDHTFAGTLFEVRQTNGQVFRASLQVALPFTSADPDWVTVFGHSQHNDTIVTMTWEVLAAGHGLAHFSRAGTPIVTLQPNPQTKLHGASIQLELTKTGTNQVQLVRRIHGETIREELPGNFRELTDEMLRTATFSAKATSGTKIELCRFQGQPFVVQVHVTDSPSTYKLKVGAAVGMGVVGLLLLVAVIWFALRKRPPGASPASNVGAVLARCLVVFGLLIGAALLLKLFWASRSTGPVGLPLPVWRMGVVVLPIAAAGMVLLIVLLRKGGSASKAVMLLVGAPLLCVAVFIAVWVLSRARVAVSATEIHEMVLESNYPAPAQPHPPGTVQQTQNGFRLQLPAAQLASFEFFIRQADDAWQPVPSLTALVATGTNSSYYDTLHWTLRRGSPVNGNITANQLWFWTVSANANAGRPLPQLTDHGTNFTHLVQQGESLDWWQLAVPASVTLKPGEQQIIPVFRTHGTATVRGGHPKEAFLRVRCEPLPAGLVSGEVPRVELGLAAQEELAKVFPPTNSVTAASTAGFKAARLTWQPNLPTTGVKPDLNDVRDQIQSLTKTGDYEAALQRQLWYYFHAEEFESSKVLRLSFGIMHWKELGARYPKARAAMVEIRDDRLRQLQSGTDTNNFLPLMQEVAALNRELGEDGATLTSFKAIAEQDEARAKRCYFVVERALVAAGDYALCRKFMGDPQQRFDLTLRSYQMSAAMYGGAGPTTPPLPALPLPGTNRVDAGLPPPMPPPSLSPISTPSMSMSDSMKRSMETSFVDSVRLLVEILVGTGDKALAEKFRDQAAAVLPHVRLNSAIADAEARIRERGASAPRAITPVGSLAPVLPHIESDGRANQLVRREVKQPNPGGKDLVMTFEELRRDAKTSTATVKRVSGASVPSAMFIARGAYDIARARGAAYFVNLKEWDAEDGTRMYLIGFAPDKNVDPKTYFDLKEPLPADKRLLFLSVSAYERIFKDQP